MSGKYFENKQFSKADTLLSGFEKPVHIIAKALVLMALGAYLISILYCSRAFSLLVAACGIVLFVLLTLSAYYLSSYIRSDKTAVILLAVLSLALLGVWNCICDTQPSSDYKVLLEGANDIINGDFPALAREKDNYFYFYNFQIGYSFYLSIFLRLFGGSLVGLKILEIVTISLTHIVVYKIMRLFRSTGESFFTAVLLIVNPYIFMGSGIPNNQHINLLLCLLVMYIFLGIKDFSLNWKNLLKYALCGLLLALSQVLRPTTTVVLAAFILCSLLYGIFQKDIKLLIGTAIIAVAYLISFNLINLCFILSELAPIGIKISNPYFKLVLGLTGEGISGIPTTDARHTQLYYDLKELNFDYDAYKEAAKEYLKTCFAERKISLFWLLLKMGGFAGLVDSQYFANTEFNNKYPFAVDVLNCLGTLLYFASVLFSFVRALKEKETVRNKAYMLWVLIFGLFLGAYILLEALTRYRYEQYYVLFFLGMPLFYGAIKELHKRMIRKKPDCNDEY